MIGMSESLIGLREPYPLESVETDCQSIVTRPWGYYRDIFRSTEHVLKTICVKPGARLSLQYHKGREEVWKILAGSGKVYLETPGEDSLCNGNFWHAYVGDLFEIRVGDIHRLINDGDKELIILELQIGNCSEDDIVRIEDDWGR